MRYVIVVGWTTNRCYEISIENEAHNGKMEECDIELQWRDTISRGFVYLLLVKMASQIQTRR